MLLKDKMKALSCRFLPALTAGLPFVCNEVEDEAVSPKELCVSSDEQVMF
jgi:hypothetical protein